MNIDLQKGMFYCFGCEASGNIIKIVAQIEAINELQAVMKINKIGAAVGPDEERERVTPRELKEQAFFFYDSLPQQNWHTIINHYMLDRGFDAKTLNRFGVRINPSSTYPVILPLMMNGRFRGYVTRRIDEGEPKYLYSVGFSRARTLFGNLKKGRVLLGEGVFDMMAGVQFGYANTCSTLGWSISPQQARILQKYATSIVCALDNDQKGDEGYLKLKSRINLPIVRFPFPDGAKDLRDLTQTQFDEGMAVAIAEVDRLVLNDSSSESDDILY